MRLTAFLTDATCGEACWEAREDVCRCSCGGKNHGCLRGQDGQRPERTCKMDGVRYRLVSVGERDTLWDVAHKICLSAGPHTISPINREGDAYSYYYTPTDKRSVCRLKYATEAQFAKWPELAAWRNLPSWERSYISLMWVQVDFQPLSPAMPKHFNGRIWRDGGYPQLAAHLQPSAPQYDRFFR